jgi:hypothetical protein
MEMSMSPHLVRHGVVLRLICGFVVQLDGGMLGAVFYATAVDDADSPVANHIISRHEV